MQPKQRILYVIDALSVGGAERLMVDLANTIDQQRFEVFVCCFSERHGNPLLSELRRLSAPPYVIGAKRLYDPRVAYALLRYIRRNRIDIIHTQLTQADIVGRIVGRLAGKPVVSTLQNIPHQYDRLRADRRWLLRRSARFLATRLTAVSSRVRDMFIAEWGIPAERIETIYNAVAMEEFLQVPSEPTHLEQDGPVIVTLGRLTRQKAHADLLTAAKLVLSERPDARFRIVGSGYLSDGLQKQAAELGIADRVEFTGVRRDVPNVLAESDVFVLSSLWEGLPLSAVEAMAAARPAVLTDVGGNAELVENGVSGYIVPPRDPAALAGALLNTIGDPVRRRKMGLQARERVRHEFDIRTVAAQYETLYDTVSRAPRRAAG